MKSLPSYEKLVKEKDIYLKKSFYARNKHFLDFHKKLIECFLNFLNELRMSKNNQEKLNFLLEYITPFAIDEGDIYFGLRTNLEDIAWKINELLLNALKNKKPLNEDELKEIELMLHEEMEKFAN